MNFSFTKWLIISIYPAYWALIHIAVFSEANQSACLSSALPEHHITDSNYTVLSRGLSWSPTCSFMIWTSSLSLFVFVLSHYSQACSVFWLFLRMCSARQLSVSTWQQDRFLIPGEGQRGRRIMPGRTPGNLAQQWTILPGQRVLGLGWSLTTILPEQPWRPGMWCTEWSPDNSCREYPDHWQRDQLVDRRWRVSCKVEGIL